MRALLERARRPRSVSEATELIEDIHHAIEPFNIAGFGDPHRNNWYPVDPQDLLRSASKVEASYEDVARMLKRCGIELPSEGNTMTPEQSLVSMAGHWSAAPGRKQLAAGR
jgi:hypothetical protein